LRAADLGFGDGGDAGERGARAGAEDGCFGGSPDAEFVVGEVRLEQSVAMRDGVLVGHAWDFRACQAAARASTAGSLRAAAAGGLGLTV
jgi:hypothetical protein